MSPIKITDYPKYRKIQMTFPNQKVTQFYTKDKMWQVSETTLENNKKEIVKATVDLITNKVLKFIKYIVEQEK